MVKGDQEKGHETSGQVERARNKGRAPLIVTNGKDPLSKTLSAEISGSAFEPIVGNRRKHLQGRLNERQTTHESTNIRLAIVRVENGDETNECRHEESTERSDDGDDLFVRSVRVSVSQGGLKEDGPESGEAGNVEVNLLDASCIPNSEGVFLDLSFGIGGEQPVGERLPRLPPHDRYDNCNAFSFTRPAESSEALPGVMTKSTNPRTNGYQLHEYVRHLGINQYAEYGSCPDGQMVAGPRK